MFIASLATSGCSEERKAQSGAEEAATPFELGGSGKARALVIGKAADLKAAVARQKGKVVVIDFWATY
jgi:hypothetical protein